MTHAIEFMHDTISVRPDRPSFLYLAPGAMHAPHQAPAAYLAKYRGAFDEGWDVARDVRFARQRDMGLFPADTKLAPRNPGVQAWTDLPENHMRLAARLREAFDGSTSISWPDRPTTRWPGSTTLAGRIATRITHGAGPRQATRRSSGTSRTLTRAACTSR